MKNHPAWRLAAAIFVCQACNVVSKLTKPQLTLETLAAQSLTSLVAEVKAGNYTPGPAVRGALAALAAAVAKAEGGTPTRRAG